MNMNLIDINLDTFSNTSLKKNKTIDEHDKFDKVIEENVDINKLDEVENPKNEISDEELSLLYTYFLQNINKSEVEPMGNIIDIDANQDDLVNKDIEVNKDILFIEDDRINQNENLNLNIDIQYLDNEKTVNSLDVEEIYDVELNTSKIELGINNTIEDTNRITSSNELDILGQISALDSNSSFNKYTIAESINDTSQVGTENKLNQEVINNIKFMKTEDIRELTIKLRPRELGDMSIKLIQENSALKAIVSVGEKDVYNMINKNISEIKQHLELFNVKDISIVLESENTYSSDSFDRSFEEHKNRHNEKHPQKGSNKNNIVNIESKEESHLNDGINLLA